MRWASRGHLGGHHRAKVAEKPREHGKTAADYATGDFGIAVVEKSETEKSAGICLLTTRKGRGEGRDWGLHCRVSEC